MSKAVLISIRPKWCELIASGKKTIEVRKTAPKIETPFKCYIYCTKDPGNKASATHFFESDDGSFHSAGKTYAAFLSGTIIGEFICDGIQDITYCDDGEHQHYQWIDAPKWAFFLNQKACLNDEELKKYLGNKDGYGWHISELKIYGWPKKLSEFGVNRAPQSWRFINDSDKRI